MGAQVISLADRRPTDQAEEAHDRAMRAFHFARQHPSFRNMAVAVDAWREFERLFLGKVIT